MVQNYLISWTIVFSLNFCVYKQYMYSQKKKKKKKKKNRTKKQKQKKQKQKNKSCLHYNILMKLVP